MFYMIYVRRKGGLIHYLDTLLIKVVHDNPSCMWPGITLQLNKIVTYSSSKWPYNWC